MIPTSELWFINIREYIYNRMKNFVNLTQKIWWSENIKCRDIETIKWLDKPFVSYSEIWWETNSFWIRESVYQIDIWATNMEEMEEIKDLIVWLFNRSNEDGVKSKLMSLWPDLWNPEKNYIHKPLTFSFVFKDQKF